MVATGGGSTVLGGCATVAGCTWFAGKGGVCYFSKGGGKRRRLACSEHSAEEACTTGECTWYDVGGKTVCYDDGDFSGTGATDATKGAYQWVIVDKVTAPAKEGNYVLQWRWDNEQTPQIWTTCADLVVSSTAPPTASPTSSPTTMKMHSAGMKATTAVAGFAAVMVASFALL